MRTPLRGFALAFLASVVAGILPGGVAARTAQVCTGPALPPTTCFVVDTSTIGGRAYDDFVVTRPGLVAIDPVRRRAELRRMDPYDAASLCAVNPFASGRESHPQVSFDGASIRLFESRFVDGPHVRVRNYAVVTFVGLRTSDGFYAPHFGLTFNRQRDDPVLRLEFFPGTDANLAGIPGLDRDVYLNIDTVARTRNFHGLEGLPVALRRTITGLAYRLKSVVGTVAEVVTVPGAVEHVWSKQEVADAAGLFSDIGFSTPLPAFTPVVTLTCNLANAGATTCAEIPELNRFRDFVIGYGADYLLTGDPAIGGVLLANLKAWAQANAMSVYPGIVPGRPNEPDFRPKYELQWQLVPIVQTWSLLRAAPFVGTADRLLIDQWLDGLVRYAIEPVGGSQNPEDPFNVGYLARSLRMAWAVLQGDRAGLAQGMEKILMGLHQMRPDGSFPREVARGACALRYQDTMLLNLLLMAEIAATQGYDAYAVEVGGKSLHTAVNFLLDAVADPTVVLGYAAQDPGNCTGAPALPALELVSVTGSPDGVSYSAWLEPYIARFPAHPNAPRLRSLLSGGLQAARPIHHAHSGGNTSCFSAEAALPPTLPPGTAAEFFHEGFGHYFITVAPDEIDALDAGVFAGWVRTGNAFKVFPLKGAGTHDVCRFFTTTFAPKSSHFYTPDAAECEGVKHNPDWQFESLVFGLKPPGATGCASGSRPLHRLYNDGRTGAPNHRYTTSEAIHGQMLAQGFVAEGIVGCVPQ